MSHGPLQFRWRNSEQLQGDLIDAITPSRPTRAPPRNLALLSAEPFTTGVLHLSYAPDPNPPKGSYEEASSMLDSA